MRNRIIAVVMTVLMMVACPLQSMAQAEAANQAGNYLEDVYVAVAKTPDEAAKALEADGWTVLKGVDGKPADLNQGANSALKKDVAVVLGYKTTGEHEKAITDLAVMNMNGGFSFASYAELMNRYRDSTIRPFIDRFMVAVQEYRANVASENPNNHAKAEFARSFLNRIVDDDTGGHLGDLLLQPTKAEMGQDYERLTEEERKSHIDLECALMQGSQGVVLMAERLLSYATDTADTTWLERLSAMGSNGFEAQYADMRPTDALNEQSARYQALANSLAQGWDSMREELLQRDQEYSDVPAQDTPAEGDEQDAQGSSYAQAQAQADARSGQPIEVVDTTDQPTSESDAVAVEESDEVDVVEELRMEAPEVPSEREDVSPSDVPEILDEATTSLKAMDEASDDVYDSNGAALYFFLKSLPYDEGTLYDLFTLPASEVTGDNISRLYPAASCLSAGQAATIEFLSLPELLQIGVTMGDAYATMWADDLGFKEMAESSAELSLYEGVNREIFSDLTALTSEAMRADALQREKTGVFDFLSQYKYTAMLWTGTAISGVLAGYSVYKTMMQDLKNIQQIDEYAKKYKDVSKMHKHLKRMSNKLTAVWREAAPIGGDVFDETLVNISRNPFAINDRSWFDVRVTRTRTTPLSLNEKQMIIKSVRGGADADAFVKNELSGKLSPKELRDDIDFYGKKMGTNSANDFFAKDSGLEEGVYSFNEAKEKVDNKLKKVAQEKEQLKTSAENVNTSWKTAIILSSVFLVLTAVSIYSTVRDVMSYYNVKYAPMPLYIVDEADITATADDGTKTVIRNDAAYYTAVLTNAARTDDDLKAMLSYADLNGDKGKEWLGLYSAKTGGDPILADSLKVVTGTSSVPDGYSTGIHMFGSDAAFNLTDSRYCYNDDANGVYAYFKRDAAPVVGSVFTSGSTALVGGLCLAAGVALGAGGMYLCGKRRREPAAA